MKKFLLSLFALILTVLPAQAAMTEFSKIKIDVPSGWTSEEDSPVVSLFAPEMEAAMTITFDTTEGLSGMEISKALSEVLKGTPPKADEHGNFVFAFTQDGVTSDCILTVYGLNYVLFTIADPLDKHGDTILKIIGSAQSM